MTAKPQTETRAVLMQDFRGEPEALLRAELAACERVLRSGWYVLGREVEAFESAWAQRCGCRHAVGVGNGMDAIEIGLRALDIGPGDEVITTPMTAFATVLAILRAGAVPVLADIRAADALLDPASVRRCLSPRTKAVLLVHLYGRIADMDEWQTLCAEHGLLLLEDCAQAHLATWRGRAAGTFGAFGAYSFYPTKNLGALGDAGALVTNSDTLAARARALRNYGQSERYHHPERGLNSRLDELHAALLLARLDWLDTFTARRRQIAARYRRELDHPCVEVLAELPAEENSVEHLFVLRCPDRDALADHLRANHVQTLIHYPVPTHRQPPTRHLRTDPAGLPRAELHASTCLSLPCHPQMTDADAGHVLAAVHTFTPR